MRPITRPSRKPPQAPSESRLIHRSDWKVDSKNLASIAFSEVHSVSRSTPVPPTRLVGRWLWGPRGDPIIKANPFETEAFYAEILAELAERVQALED
jgi:hypothetical protein